MDEIRTLTARYRVEADHRIGWTSANWDRFAEENGAPELAGGSVLGHSLWDYIEGSETRALYNSILQRVRETGSAFVLAFRCDSPEKRRFMRLRMSSSEEGQLLLVAELLREEPRPRVRLLDSACPRQGAPVVICSFCKRVESGRGDWCEVEEAEKELELDEAATLPPLFHAVCPDCKNAAQGLSID